MSRRGIQNIASWLQLSMAVVGIGLVLVILGWPMRSEMEKVALLSLRFMAIGYGSMAVVEVFSDASPWRFVKTHWVSLLTAALIFFSAFGEMALSSFLRDSVGGLSLHGWLIVLVVVQQSMALATRIGEAVPWIERHLFSRITPGLFLAGTFAALSLLGSLLLMMPNCTVEGIKFLDAFFTSTSAVCVTGLVVVDTATAFTPLGHGILLILIQLGGFGIVTITFFMAMLIGQGMTISSGVFLRDMLSAENLGRLGSALSFIIAGTFFFEAMGAVMLYHSWQDEGLSGNLVWISVFHSVSAFCNAGFSTLPDGLANWHIEENRWGQLSIMCLIVTGGIGFPVLREFWNLSVGRIVPAWSNGKASRWGLSVHAKTVLITTAILVFGGAILFFIAHRFTAHGNWEHAFWLGLFRSITARTAGFNISDLGAMSQGAAAVMMVLMLIGGSPGGMAGGIKTTTASIAFLNLLRTLRGKREVNLFNRRIEESVAQRSFSVLLISLAWVMSVCITILLIQPELNFVDVMFESVSAFGTVGVTRGITDKLNDFNRILIILTMFVGRVGLLNFLLSLLPKAREARLRYPSGNVYTE